MRDGFWVELVPEPEAIGVGEEGVCDGVDDGEEGGGVKSIVVRSGASVRLLPYVRRGLVSVGYFL